MEPVDRFSRPLEKHVRRVVSQRGQRSRERSEVPATIEPSRCRRLVRAVADQEYGVGESREESVEPCRNFLVGPVLQNVLGPVESGLGNPLPFRPEIVDEKPAPQTVADIVRGDYILDDIDADVPATRPHDDFRHPLAIPAAEVDDGANPIVGHPLRKPIDKRPAEIGGAPGAAPAVPRVAGIDAAENRLRVHTIHLVFGMTPDFGGKPWSWVHHTAIECAKAANPGAEVWLWYEHEPAGKWWDATAPLVIHRRIKAPNSIHGRPLIHPAHRADVVRLEALERFGGAYIDSDVWCLRPFGELEHGGFLMGWQGRAYGLCNATMIADAGSPFVSRWLAEYATFRSTGHDRYWDEHSVRLPRKLARQHPHEITTVPAAAFFEPDWHTVHEVFQAGKPPRLNLAWSCHLWESKTWNWLQHMTPDTIDRGSEIARRLRTLGVL